MHRSLYNTTPKRQQNIPQVELIVCFFLYPICLVHCIRFKIRLKESIENDNLFTQLDYLFYTLALA
jgi:hypothetical protein